MRVPRHISLSGLVLSFILGGLGNACGKVRSTQEDQSSTVASTDGNGEDSDADGDGDGDQSTTTNVNLGGALNGPPVHGCSVQPVGASCSDAAGAACHVEMEEILCAGTRIEGLQMLRDQMLVRLIESETATRDQIWQWGIEAIKLADASQTRLRLVSSGTNALILQQNGEVIDLPSGTWRIPDLKDVRDAAWAEDSLYVLAQLDGSATLSYWVLPSGGSSENRTSEFGGAEPLGFAEQAWTANDHQPLVHLRKENTSHLYDLALNALSPISLDIAGDSMAVVAGTIYLASLVPRRGGIFSFDEAGAHGSLSITEDWCYDVVQGNSQYNACEVAPQQGTPGNWARWLMTPGVERPWVLGWDDTNAGSCATWTCFETLSCYCKYVPPSMRSITTLTLREVTGYRKVDIAIPELRQAPVVQAASWDNDVLHVVYSTGSPNLEGALQLYHVKLEIF